MEKIEAYWFAASDTLPHGDRRKIVVGKSHSLRGEIVICQHALHASRHPFDALRYAPGPYLYKVLCSGDVIEHNDKLGCRRREYVAKIDATDLLWRFARERATGVLHLWDAPQVVKDYLATGDDTLRLAAARAAHAAAGDAARAAHAAAYAAYAASYAAYAAARAAYAAARAAARERFAEMVEQAFQAEKDNA